MIEVRYGCHIEKVVKVKTMDGKSEKEWKKEGRDTFGQKAGLIKDFYNSDTEMWAFKNLIGFEPPLFWQALPLFLQTEIGNPPLNFTWNKIWSISIKNYQKSSIILYVSVNNTQSPKRMTDWSAVKDGISFHANQTLLLPIDRYEVQPSLCKVWSRFTYPVYKDIVPKKCLFIMKVGQSFSGR